MEVELHRMGLKKARVRVVNSTFWLVGRVDAQSDIAFAEKIAKALETAKITVGAKVGEAGTKIFGSVNNIQLADSIQKLGHDVDKKNIKILGSQIKEVGTYQAELRLHKEVSVTVDFEVVAE